MPAPQFVRPKIHKAEIINLSRPIPLSALHRNGHAYALAIYGRGTAAKWVLLDRGNDIPTLRTRAADIPQHWRIIDTATAIIAEQG
jgi:hypothetical protein